MEKLLLGGFLAGDELDIIHQEQVRLPVLGAEFNVFAVFDGVNQFVGELVAFDIDNVGIGIFLADAVGDGIQQMGLAHAGRAVEKQRVIHLARSLADGKGGGVGEAVGRSNHKIVKGKLGIEVHGVGGGPFGLAGVQLLVPENQKFCVGVENFF